jgi:hypothetical protein
MPTGAPANCPAALPLRQARSLADPANLLAVSMFQKKKPSSGGDTGLLGCDRDKTMPHSYQLPTKDEVPFNAEAD